MANTSLDFKRLPKRDALPPPEDMANYRAKKAGIALHIQKKLEQRYEEEDGLGTPDRIVKWMNAILDGEHPACTAVTFRRLHFFFRDGTALCKLISKLRVADGMSAIKYQKNAHTPFVALENIEIFNKAAGEYGVVQEALFQSGDLYEGNKGQFLNVINCLNKLGFVANKKEFEPKYESVEPEERDSERWAST